MSGRALIVLIAAGLAFQGLADDSKPAGVKWKNVRNYTVVKPAGYDPEKKYPFILSLHGFTSNGAGQARFFPLKDLADKYGFLYSFPSGLDRSWNATDACCDWRRKNDDSSYLRNFILWAQKEYSIDKDRVYLTGLSNGGFMSYRMATDHADIITAIVPFAGVGFSKWPRKPAGPVSVLHIHGTKDSTIRWQGGRIFTKTYPSAQENFKMWREFNGCDQKVEVKEGKIDLARRVPGKETEVTRFVSKNGGVVTELWRVENGGHVTPPIKEARERIIKWLLARSK